MPSERGGGERHVLMSGCGRGAARANPFPCSSAADRGGEPQAALRGPRHPRQHRGEVRIPAARLRRGAP